MKPDQAGFCFIFEEQCNSEGLNPVQNIAFMHTTVWKEIQLL